MLNATREIDHTLCKINNDAVRGPCIADGTLIEDEWAVDAIAGVSIRTTCASHSRRKSPISICNKCNIS